MPVVASWLFLPQALFDMCDPKVRNQEAVLDPRAPLGTLRTDALPLAQAFLYAYVGSPVELVFSCFVLRSGVSVNDGSCPCYKHEQRHLECLTDSWTVRPMTY